MTKRSYVMAVAGKLRVNVSLHVRFSSREDARTWARVFAEAHRLSPEILIGRRR